SDRAPLPRSCTVRMHATFLQAGTDTGRLAMTEPSLHVIPRPIEYNLDVPHPGDAAGGSSALHGQALCTIKTVSLNIRAAFVAPPGHVFLSMDYKQVCSLWCPWKQVFPPAVSLEFILRSLWSIIASYRLNR
ncbi:hypothetical protein DUNSADRAFT_11639, partial [Dunaliella salina]